MPDNEKTITFEDLQSYADKLEEKFTELNLDAKKYEKEYLALGEKMSCTKIESAFAAAEWRGVCEFAKSLFGKELESKASKAEPDPKEETSV